ncbi:hypothetical protein BU24DRAFT_402903 [Aaosphaeria arxii CBS 175.79]|uniref:RING-type domain-containing protein n=1 Tax=Aaosphaeria arxii CBS 175.79 TaxID=1450172 RepID=A0A6A5X6Y3_9PLEO|nr:uncharacterized protein BU24DRAFT_402903 [Aaosphaeria arxii CBS 175.79]KAF2008661.1 hypothetical protein BU24DRAFT_402903 [Aaosphaeria arxii CBS 175.79]
MAEDGRAGLMDLEKELTCSICTDLLYQPLTLLDCLHTFCGACLKEWFQFQASTATSIHPYTCPSCRASVRTTQPNATVTTLLDMFVKANPERGKSDSEKSSDREKYKPGDNIMPKLRRRDGQDEEEDRRMLEEVQQLSLREMGIPSASANTNANATLEPPRERRRRERSRDASRESRDSRRTEGRSRSRNPPEERRSREIIPPRHVEHQSSLRSLLSSSELDSQEMEEEIMRQIMEEGLLDGIDLNNIDVAQEDEISERIAQAYRRRQSERQRERRERRERLAREGRAEAPVSGSSTPQDVRSPPIRSDEEQARRRHARSESMTATPHSQSSSRAPPPVSRPGLIEAANQGTTRQHHRRSSSQGSSRSARRSERPAPLSVTSTRQGSHSTNDLGERPATAGIGSAPRRLSENQQRGSLEERQQFRSGLRAHSSSNPNSPRRAMFNGPTAESPSSTTAIVASPLSSPPESANPIGLHPPNTRRTTDPTSIRQPRPANDGTPPMLSPATFPRSVNDSSAVGLPTSSSAAAPTPPPPTLYAEPNISCKRCNKQHIEYELHYHCSSCNNGDYDICITCYRASRGCEHWYGFGWAAWPRYERKAPAGGYPPNHEHPHILVGRRYRRPQTPMTESPTPPHTLMTEDDPAYRLESGVFCDLCKAYANGCYWKCEVCNEGDWGFCNDCVNQGRHCTHPLLPVAHQPKQSTLGGPTSDASSPHPEPTSQAAPISPGLSPPAHEATTPPRTPRTAAPIRGPGLVTIANSIFRPLTFTTVCNICTYPIPPSCTRYHCLKCNKGDYDICTGCYQKLIVSSRISKEDGMNGWRRCLRGHRMVLVGFEDRSGGQRRVVVRNLVGGWALREDSTLPEPRSPQTENAPPPKSSSSSTTPPPTSSSQQQSQKPRLPPDGGVGLIVQANWSYFPAGDNVADELAFPRFAEIREAEDINGDWFWGVYAGAKGLFPGNYGRVLGSV